jgi:hypothetical protein
LRVLQHEGRLWLRHSALALLQVGAYKLALATKRREVEEMVARLDGGLQKLVQAAAEVRSAARSQPHTAAWS